jgi:hypothetical protein
MGIAMGQPAHWYGRSTTGGVVVSGNFDSMLRLAGGTTLAGETRWVGGPVHAQEWAWKGLPD